MYNFNKFKPYQTKLNQKPELPKGQYSQILNSCQDFFFQLPFSTRTNENLNQQNNRNKLTLINVNICNGQSNYTQFFSFLKNPQLTTLQMQIVFSGPDIVRIIEVPLYHVIKSYIYNTNYVGGVLSVSTDIKILKCQFLVSVRFILTCLNSWHLYSQKNLILILSFLALQTHFVQFRDMTLNLLLF
eukprot:TRINITY_DN11152_c1_g1_i5.p3 TRINITY_DN11152_c1_g1~~TRINITY_DN11152_c1_g1_i5.p3  ORF type:complete len:186 (+),score=-16.92 TRINITY_DN11152_c1_g1_i5:586-1143(+)